jgi:hypothetical protein
MRLLAKALRRNFSPSLSVPVGESPTGTGESPVLPNQNGAGYEISGLERPLVGRIHPKKEYTHINRWNWEEKRKAPHPGRPMKTNSTARSNIPIGGDLSAREFPLSLVGKNTTRLEALPCSTLSAGWEEWEA